MTREEAERTLARLHEAQAAFYAGGPREPLHDVLTEDVVWVVPGAQRHRRASTAASTR